MVAVGSGIVAWAFVGLGLGWSSPSTQLVKKNEAVQTALVPICAEKFAAIPAALAEFGTVQTYNLPDVVRKHVPSVSNVSVDYTFANKCVDAVALKLKNTAK